MLAAISFFFLPFFLFLFVLLLAVRELFWIFWFHLREREVSFPPLRTSLPSSALLVAARCSTGIIHRLFSYSFLLLYFVLSFFLHPSSIVKSHPVLTVARAVRNQIPVLECLFEFSVSNIMRLLKGQNTIPDVSSIVCVCDYGWKLHFILFCLLIRPCVLLIFRPCTSLSDRYPILEDFNAESAFGFSVGGVFLLAYVPSCRHRHFSSTRWVGCLWHEACDCGMRQASDPSSFFLSLRKMLSRHIMVDVESSMTLLTISTVTVHNKYTMQ